MTEQFKFEAAPQIDRTANWSALEGAPTQDQKEGKHGPECDGCGLWLWAFGGYQAPGVQGRYCSIFCLEAKAFGHRKITQPPGARLLSLLSSKNPELYRAVTGGAAGKV